MRFNEIDTQKTITEAPQGFFSKMGNKAAAWAGDKMGGTDFGARASGRLDTGKLANQLHAAFQYYLGQTGSKPTGRAVLAFLQSKGYPIKAAKTILNKAAIALNAKAADKFKSPTSPSKGIEPAIGAGSTAGTATDLGSVVSEGVNDPLPQKAIDQAFLAAAQEAIMMKANASTSKPAAKATAAAGAAPVSTAAPAAKDDVVGLIKTINDPMTLHHLASAIQKRIRELSVSNPAMAAVTEGKKAKKK